MIAIVDSGGANLASVIFAVERLGKAYQFTSDPDQVKKASHVILPGVGTATNAMEILRARGLVECLKSLTQPVLGICLGMQLLFARSAEGDVNTLDLIPGNVDKFPAGDQPVPHMGWNTISITRPHPIVANILNESYMYFVHSYFAPVGSFTLAATEYAVKFSSIVHQDNFFGFQFHPERSGAQGAQLLKNFTEL